MTSMIIQGFGGNERQSAVASDIRSCFLDGSVRLWLLNVMDL